MKDVTAELFRRQHGVLCRRDARAAGLSIRQIQERVRSGAWIELSPGVYRHPAAPPTPEQAILAAVLASGPRGVASHQAAAYLWRLLRWEEAGARAAVTVPSAGGLKGYGFDVHRSSDLDPARTRLWRGIPCTDPLRTLVDLAAIAGDGDGDGKGTRLLDTAIERGLAIRLFTVAGLEAETKRLSRRGRNGVGRLRERLVDRGFAGGPSPSVLEGRALQFLRRYRIPMETRELKAGPDGEFRIDFVLAHPDPHAPGVAWELDGYVWHFTPEHKARDDDRRNALRLEGWELYVSDWKALTMDPASVATTLRAALSRRRTPARP